MHTRIHLVRIASESRPKSMTLIETKKSTSRVDPHFNDGNVEIGRHTDRSREEGKTHTGRQGGENGLAIDLLAKAGRHFDFDASGGLSSVPAALLGGALMEVWPLQVMDDCMAAGVEACAFGCSLSVDSYTL